MILFLEDWYKYPNAIADTETSNKSFVRISALYREMGIENHLFPLALLNPSLQGVNPHDPNLPREIIADIAEECKLNFFYFIREVARVPGQSGSPPIPLRANRGNMALYWLFFNHIVVFLIQIRQTGKSLSTDILMRYLMNIRCTNTHINLLTKDDDLRSKNIERLKEIENVLPYYFRLKRKDDTSNTEEFSINALGNTYKGILPQRSPKLALNVGRGFTSPIFQGDEVAFLPNIELSLPAALAAGGAARDIAAANGEPYGTILTTTSGKKDDRDGRFIFNQLQEAALWTEKFFDAKNLEELEILVRNSAPGNKLRVNCTFSHRQLGYTDEWLMKTLEDAMVSGEAADRDYFNIWTSGNQLSPLPVDLMEKVKNSKRNDFYARISKPYNYVTRWFYPESQIANRLKNDFFILTLDTSDAVGGDDIALTFTSVKNGETIAAGNYNETNLITFCEWLINEWFFKINNFVCIIERRSTGSMIMDYLILMLVAKGIDPFKVLYNKVVQEYEEYPERFKEIEKPLQFRNQDIYVRYKKLFGFATSGTGITSRSELYSSILTKAVKITGDVIKDPKVVDQILSLEIRNGRVDHPEGGHDDSVISWLLSRWLLFEGKKLSFYGINASDILSMVKKEQNISPIQKFNSIEQQNIRKEIEGLVEKIKSTRDLALSSKYEIQLRNLANKLVLEDSEHFSVETLLKQIKDQKQINFASNRSFNNSGIYSQYQRF